MRRPLQALAAMAALLLTAAGCSDTPGTATAPERSPALAQALELVPASVSRLQFYDPAAAKARWGMSEVNGSTATDESQAELLHQYLEKSMSSATGTTLQQYAMNMDDWGWNGFDVSWEITFTSKSGPPVTISRLRDGLDMTTVTDSLTAHKFTRSGPDDAPRFDRSLEDAGGGVSIFISGVTVIPAENLLIAGPKEFTRPDAESSLASNDTVLELTEGLTQVDSAFLSLGADSCLDPAALLGEKASEETVERLTEEYRSDELAPIGGATVAVTDDTTAVVHTSYADEQAAKADLPRRERLLTDAPSVISRQPYSKLFDADVSVDGRIMTYRLSVDGPIGRIMSMVTRMDTPWAFCG